MILHVSYIYTDLEDHPTLSSTAGSDVDTMDLTTSAAAAGVYSQPAGGTVTARVVVVAVLLALLYKAGY